MKVIGKIDINKYICEVSHTEIEKFMNKYYDSLNKLDVGDEISLGKGYDFFSETKDALNETQKFLKAHKKVIEAITNGINIIGTGK